MYDLFYWPGIPGRGEFVRLALEDAAIPYNDVSLKDDGARMTALMEPKNNPNPSFAPPFLKAGRLMIGQTANILLYLGEKHNLAPKSEQGKYWTHQMQLTIADIVTEVHDGHHPLSLDEYYEQQKAAAKKRTHGLRTERLPKFLGYFENILKKSGGPYLNGAKISYADLSLFHIVEGIGYAFPRANARYAKSYRKVFKLADLVAKRPNIAAYIKSTRRQPFNTDGIFRHYPELDG